MLEDLDSDVSADGTCSESARGGSVRGVEVLLSASVVF